jgi:sugar phosphate isomerase/epimerase
VDAAAETGFGAVTLFPEHYLDAIAREGLTASEMRRHLQGAGVSVHQLDPLLDWYSNDASKSELVAALRAGGCQAPMGVEVFNSALHRLPPRDVARRAMDACLRVAGDV